MKSGALVKTYDVARPEQSMIFKRSQRNSVHMVTRLCISVLWAAVAMQFVGCMKINPNEHGRFSQSSDHSPDKKRPPLKVSLLDAYPLVKNLKENPTMTESRFHEMIDAAVSVYQAETLGLRINDGKTVQDPRDPKIVLASIQRWDDPTVNASAGQPRKGAWEVTFYRGLATRMEFSDEGPALDGDGFMVVICHEIGHHFGGYPFIHHWGRAPLTVEGNADYFATAKCLRRIWHPERDKNRLATAKLAKMKDAAQSKMIRDLCNSNWKAEADIHLCYRISLAGLATAMLWNHLETIRDGTNESISVLTHDLTFTDTIQQGHPPAQIRLDTYISGALCNKHFESEQHSWIPGIIPQGIDSKLPDLDYGHKLPPEVEKMEMENTSCTFREPNYEETKQDYVSKLISSGARPRGWYSPEVLLMPE